MATQRGAWLGVSHRGAAVAAALCFCAQGVLAQATPTPAAPAAGSEAEGAAPAPAPAPAEAPGAELPSLDEAVPERGAVPAPAPGADSEAGADSATATVTATDSDADSDADTDADPKSPPDFPQGALPPGTEKREEPDLDGREDEPTTAGDVALWVPRVGFFPLYLVSEYVVRRPLGALVTAAEEGNWLAIMTDFFTFDEEQKIGVVPTAYIEFDFEPSVGLYFFADDAFVDHNDIRVVGALWPDDWWSLSVLDRISSEDDDLRLAVRGKLLIRPDYQFHGIGPETRDADEVRYSSELYEAAVRFDGLPWRASTVHWESGPRSRSFDAESDFDSPDLAAAVADPDHPIDVLPPGFGGYTIYRNALSGALATREPFPAPATGVRLEVRGEHAFDLEEPVERRWVRYGGAVGGFLDILNHRVISLSLDVELSEPLAGEIPFTELPTLGGGQPMLGFQEGRLYDRSSAVGTFEYRWPVWIWADFALHYAVGNVFGQDLEGFELDRMRSSFGLGLRAARMSRPDHSINFLIAFGTETFEQGHGIDTVRFAVGGTSGF